MLGEEYRLRVFENRVTEENKWTGPKKDEMAEYWTDPHKDTVL
jgi:hypothetical protein